MSLLTTAVLVPFVVALFVPLAYRVLGRKVGWLAAVVPAALVLFFLSRIGVVAEHPISTSLVWSSLLNLNLTLTLDGLSLLFAIIITGVGLLVVVYSVYYMGPREDLGKFYLYLLLFMGAMLGVVTAGNLLLLYVFWELTTFSSFFLIGFWHTREESRQGALKALLITVIGGLAILAAVTLVFMVTGTFELSEVLAKKDILQASPLYRIILGLIFLGAFTKSAQVPFHIWLPGAMAAPTPVSAYLHSATMVKAGLFLLARLSPILGGTPEWFYPIATFGLVTMVVGGFLAIQQDDLKALLAFSTVSQLGFIMSMFAFGTEEAATAGAFHILNHATFKGALFMLVGIIDHETGTRLLSRLSGLRKHMPITALLMPIAALSLAGVPLLNGFLSKEMIFSSLLEPPFGHGTFTVFLAVMAVLGSIFTMIYSLMVGFRVFWGPETNALDKHPHEAPLGMLAGPMVLVALVVIIGLFPGLVAKPILGPAAGAIVHEAVHPHIALWHGVNTPLVMSLIALGVGGLGYAFFKPVLRLLQWIRFKRIHGNAAYEALLYGLDHGAKWSFNVQMTGLLRDYLVFILAAVLAAVGYTFWRGLPEFFTFDVAPISAAEVVILSIVAIAAVAVVFAKRRLQALIALGMVGAFISLLWVLLRAPDLALTQIMVEAVTTVLILLAFTHLPRLEPEKTKATTKFWNVVVSVGTGVIVGLLSFVGLGTRLFEPISSYFVEHSLDLAGGHNIVNVILVDFRGFDTMGEITVLTIAGLSAYALIRLRPVKKGRQGDADDVVGEEEI